MCDNYRIDTYQRSNMDTQEELEADYFAVCLLVPGDLLMRILRETDNIDAIADYFGVSSSVIRCRINWLKINLEDAQAITGGKTND